MNKFSVIESQNGLNSAKGVEGNMIGQLVDFSYFKICYSTAILMCTLVFLVTTN